jgi:hypothetical protein
LASYATDFWGWNKQVLVLQGIAPAWRKQFIDIIDAFCVKR